MGNATITAGLGVQIILTCVNSYVGQITVRVREHNHVTGNEVGIRSSCIGIPGNTAACFVRKILQAGLPSPYRGSGIRAVIHGCCLNGLIDMSRIHTFDIGQVVVDEVAHERTANKALFTELRHIGSSTRNGGRVRYRFITIYEGRIVVISDARQDIRCIGFQIAGNVLSDIQIAVIFQPLNVKTRILQRPKNCIVIHLIRDGLHVCSCHCKHHDFFGE